MKVERGRKNMYGVQEDDAVQGKGFIKATAKEVQKATVRRQH